MKTLGQDAAGLAGIDDDDQSIHGDEMHGFESARGNLLDAKNEDKVPQSADCGIEMTNR